MAVNTGILTVSALNTYIKSIIESDINLSSVLIRGEISNFSNHYQSGHLYFSLKDHSGVIRCVMFKSYAQKLRFLPENGMHVVINGKVAIYERDGRYQLYVYDMHPFGAGDFYIAYEKLKQKLKAEGLFDESGKRKVKRFPQRIGLITSRNGAALRDILNILSRRYPIGTAVLYPVLVQGDAASGQIVEGIRYFNTQNPVDTIIIARGGGSIEELWAFNHEELARNVAASVIPVISAVGHETDTTICDYAADLRAPTPSAAAELAAVNVGEIIQYYHTLYKNCLHRVQKIMAGNRQHLLFLWERLQRQSPENIVKREKQLLFFIQKELYTRMQNKITQAGHQLKTVSGKLDALSPLAVLARGYAIPMTEKGSRIVSVRQLREKEIIKLRFQDGQALCMVRNMQQNADDGMESRT